MNLSSQFINHNELVSLFHEFGHILYYLCNKSKYCLTVNMSEVPSYMLELLTYNIHFLKKLLNNNKSHNNNSDNNNSDNNSDNNINYNDYIHNIIINKYKYICLSFKFKIMIAIFDLYIHSSNKFIETCMKNDNKNNYTLINNALISFFTDYISPDNNIIYSKESILPHFWNYLLNKYFGNYYENIISEIDTYTIIMDVQSSNIENIIGSNFFFQSKPPCNKSNDNNLFIKLNNSSTLLNQSIDSVDDFSDVNSIQS